MIELIAYLLRTSRAVRFSTFFVLVALTAGLLSGAGYAALIAILNSALSGRRGAESLWAFVSFCLVILLTRLASQGLFDFVALKTVFDVRLQLCRRILATPLRQLEEVGSQRLAGALSDDITTLSAALTQLPRVFMNLAIALACLAYLGWLSWKLFLFTLGFMAVGIVVHQILLTKANLFFRRLREQRGVQLAQLRALIDGAKELRLQRWRRLDLVRSGLIPTSEAIRRSTFSGNAFTAGATTWGNLLFFLAVVLLLAGPGRRQGIEQQVVTGYTLTLLYMLLPLELFFLSLPALGRAGTAVRRLESLGRQLAAPPEPVAVGSSPAASWRSLDLVDVTYTDRGAEGGEEGFPSPGSAGETARRKPMRETLQLVAFLARISRGIPGATWRIVAALALSVLSGTLFPLLLATVGAAISQGLDRALLLRFLVLFVATPCARLASQMLFDAIWTRSFLDLRLELCRQFLAAPLARLEAIGAPRLLASLNDDMAAIASTFSLLPVIAVQVGVAAGLLVYMAWLSPHWFLLVAGAFALGIGVLRLPGLRASRYSARANREADAMSARLRDLIAGGKELQLHRERRRAFLDRELVPAGEALYRSTLLSSAASTVAGTWSSLLFFVLPGLVLFGAGRSGTDLPVLAGYALALFYIRTPTGFLLQSSPALGRASAAAVALQRLESELAAGAGEPEPGERESSRGT
jgi:ABC-type siderophore export system fused ATPase/permease subunit